MPQLAAVERSAYPVLGSSEFVAELLERPNVLRQGHFRLLGGLHTDAFLAFSGIAIDPNALDRISDLALPTALTWGASAVLAPSTAGVGLGSTLARRLGGRLHLAGLDTEARACGIIGRSLESGARVLVVNDIVTTGAGILALARAARAAGAEVVGAAWFASRALVDIEALIDAPSVHITDVPLAAWPGGGCPLCFGGTPLDKAVDLN